MSKTSKVIFNTCNLLSELWKVPHVSRLSAYELHVLVNTCRLPLWVVFACIFLQHSPLNRPPCHPSFPATHCHPHRLGPTTFQHALDRIVFPRTWSECACMFVRRVMFIIRAGMHNFFIYLSAKAPSGCSCFSITPVVVWESGVEVRVREGVGGVCGP